MFGLFKKKPLDVKYGHENYLEDYASFEVNDRNWILMLSALYVESQDIDMWEHRARHDLLEMYPEGVLDESAKEELYEALTLENTSEIKTRMDYVSELVSRGFEDEVYAVINSNSLDEVKAIAKEEHEDDDEKQELYEEIWKKREHYEQTHMRLGFLVQTMWQIRLAAYFSVIHEDVAWSHLETLADFIRPLITLYSSWEMYNLNIQQFNDIYEYDNTYNRKYMERAIACLNLREESPLKLIPFDLGVDMSYKYNIKSHSNKFPTRIPSGQYPLRVMMAELLAREDKTELFKEMNKLSGREYNEEFTFIVNESDMNSFSEEDLIELPEKYSNHYAYAMRAHHFYTYAWEARGSDTSDKVGEENYKLFYERLEWSLNDLLKAHELAPMDRLVWQHLYEVLSHFNSDVAIEKRDEIYKLIQEHALDHIGCVYGISRHKQERWGGSFEENLDWAREVIAGTKKGDPVRTIIYDVMIERADYINAFEEDEKKAEAIFRDKQVQAEVNQYFDELLENLDANPYGIVDTLCFWYSKAGDYDRLRQIVHTMEVGKFDLDAMNDSYTDEYTEIIMNWFRSV